MELTKEQRVRFNTMLLDAYKSFKVLCEENDIKYFACGGTMIGAVRHGGMIPWDDDIDVYMFREDYDRFLSLKQTILGSDYEIVDPSDKGYYCAMAKYSHKKSTLWEIKEIPFLMGVYIDIFVLDFEDGPYEDVVKRRMNFSKMIDLYCQSSILRSWKSILNTLPNVPKTIWYCTQKCLIHPFRSVFQKKMFWSPKKKKGEWMVAYTGTSLKKDVFRSEWFINGLVDYSFEDTTVPVPNGYDAFLTHMFGNYMSLPPEEKRVTHHPHYYLNLDRRITDEEKLHLFL